MLSISSVLRGKAFIGMMILKQSQITVKLSECPITQVALLLLKLSWELQDGVCFTFIVKIYGVQKSFHQHEMIMFFGKVLTQILALGH